jgi:N-acetylneuraminic acid mutarotase
LLNDGAVYDPVSDQWSGLSLANAPAARCDATLVWTGSRAIIWGGLSETGALDSGAQLLCDTNGLPTAWAAINSSNAPTGRSGHAAVWTGQTMLVWGGDYAGTYLADGAAYDPVANAWSPLTATNAPSPREGAAWVWTGQEMLVFGGETGAGTAADGGAYNPLTGQWRALSGLGSPLARSGATAAWTGSELLVFAGLSNGTPLASLQRLNPQPAWYLYRKL